jgi:shikimate dehydrogenase
LFKMYGMVNTQQNLQNSTLSSELKSRAYAVDQSSPKLLVGLIGSGIQRSLSPAMHEREAAHHGIRLHYQIVDLGLTEAGSKTLPSLLTAAQHMGFAGLNITYPCKQQVLEYLDELSDEARAMNAVNTVVFKDGRRYGFNTDGLGWAWGIERTLPMADFSNVVLLGAGGAGSAIAHSLARKGCQKLAVIDSDAQRAQLLALDIEKHYGIQTTVDTDPAGSLKNATGLVHATPTGMDKLPGLPLAEHLVQANFWVSEIVYFPLETALLKLARKRGCHVVDGGTMAVGQAVGAFKHFTGLEAVANRIDEHFRQMVAQR